MADKTDKTDQTEIHYTRFELEFVASFDPGEDLKWAMTCPDCGAIHFSGSMANRYAFSMDSLSRVVYSHRCFGDDEEDDGG